MIVPEELMTLKACCAPCDCTELNTALIGGGIILKMRALIAKYAAELGPVLPELEADLLAGNYLAAGLLIIETLASQPAPAPAPAS